MVSNSILQLTLSDFYSILFDTVGIQLSLDEYFKMIDERNKIKEYYKDYLLEKDPDIKSKRALVKKMAKSIDPDFSKVGLDYLVEHIKNDIYFKIFLETYLEKDEFPGVYEDIQKLSLRLGQIIKDQKLRGNKKEFCLNHKRLLEQMKMQYVLIDNSCLKEDLRDDVSFKYLCNYLSVRISGNEADLLEKFIHENKSSIDDIRNKMLYASISLDKGLDPNYFNTAFLGLKVEEKKHLEKYGLDNFVSLMSKDVYCHVMKDSGSYIMDFYVLQDTEYIGNLVEMFIGFDGKKSKVYSTQSGNAIVYNEYPSFRYDVKMGAKRRISVSDNYSDIADALRESYDVLCGVKSPLNMMLPDFSGAEGIKEV